MSKRCVESTFGEPPALRVDAALSQVGGLASRAYMSASASHRTAFNRTPALSDTGFAATNDWFILPLGQQAGTVRQITEVTVVDTFGVVTPVPPAETAGWRVFTLAAWPRTRGAGCFSCRTTSPRS